MRSVLLITALFAAVTAFAAAPGGDIFYSKCTKCHGSALSLNKTKTEKQWIDTVKRMKKHGLSISSAETAAVAEFLSGGK